MAVNPLVPISKTLGVVKYTSGLTQKTLRGMSTILSEKRSDRRVISSSIKILKQRRVQDTKRRNTQEVIAAPTVVTRYKGPALLAQRSDNTSFTSRIMGFLGYLAAGWALRNLPTWTAIGGQLIERIGETSGVMVQLGSTIQNFIFDIGGLFQAAFANLKQFDFTDGSGRLRSSLDELSGTIMTMGNQLEEALSILTQPFLDVPPIGSRSEKPSAYDKKPKPQEESILPGVNSAEMYRIAAALSTEGTGSQSNVDMMQVVVNRKASGKYGKTYTDILAAPGPQFAGVWSRPGGPKGFRKIQTLNDAAKWSGQGKQTLLKIIDNIQNTTLQTKAATFVGGATEFRASPLNIGVRYPGTSWRGGRGDNQFLTAQAQGYPYTYIIPGGAAPFNLPVPITAKTQPLPAGFDPNKRYRKDQTVPSGAGVGAVITSRRGWRWGGMHGGIDVAMPIGTYVTCKYPCVIREAKYEYGYGYYLDVIIPALSIRIRLAHLSPRSYYFKGYPSAINGLNINWPAGKPLVKSGQTGRVTGPHLHLEASKNMRGVSTGASDPNAVEPDPYVDAFIYSSNPPGGIEPVVDGKNLKGKPSGTPTTSADGYSTNVATPEGELQIDSASLATFGKLMESLTTEQKGRKIVVIDDRKPSSPVMLSAGGGNSVISSGTNEFTLVNNFMKNKLLLDLTYL